MNWAWLKTHRENKWRDTKRPLSQAFYLPDTFAFQFLNDRPLYALYICLPGEYCWIVVQRVPEGKLNLFFHIRSIKTGGSRKNVFVKALHCALASPTLLEVVNCHHYQQRRSEHVILKPAASDFSFIQIVNSLTAFTKSCTVVCCHIAAVHNRQRMINRCVLES